MFFLFLFPLYFTIADGKLYYYNGKQLTLVFAMGNAAQSVKKKVAPFKGLL
jgi:hypothetical protein